MVQTTYHHVLNNCSPFPTSLLLKVSWNVGSLTQRGSSYLAAPMVDSWPVTLLVSTQASTRSAWLATPSSIWPPWSAALTFQTGTFSPVSHWQVSLGLFKQLYGTWLLMALSIQPPASSRAVQLSYSQDRKRHVVCFCRCTVEAGYDYSTGDQPDPEVWAQMLNKSPIKHVTQVWLFQHLQLSLQNILCCNKVTSPPRYKRQYCFY